MYTFPFTRESVQAELCTKLMAYRNEYPTNRYTKKCIFTMHENGSITGHTNWSGWEVEGGILYILDKSGGRSYRLDSLETTNGTVYPMGESLREGKSAFSKFVISPVTHPTVPFGICVSSHKDYYQTTVPHLLKSLKRINMTNNVHVVIADISKRPQPLESLPSALDGLGIVVSRVGIDRYGYTALLDVDTGEGCPPYWLLVHDTCEFMPNFPEQLFNIDFGLNPDFIFLGENIDMGFYSSDFIRRVKPMIEGLSPAKIRGELKRMANKWIDGQPVEALPEKDVYGTGNKRMVLRLEIGIKKFGQTKVSGAKA